jgi:hypothetical protein
VPATQWATADRFVRRISPFSARRETPLLKENKMSTQVTERPGGPGGELDPDSLLAAFTPAGRDALDNDGLFLGPVRLVVQAPDIRNDYKKSAGSSDGAKTYDTTAA